MAKRDLITFRSGKFWGVNVRYKVGPNLDNGPADVKLIQALFRYLSYSAQNIKGELGYSDSDLPEINGKFDAKTQSVIKKFQQKNAAKLMSTDGSIHPASYEGRTIRVNHWDPLLPNPRQRMMTITLLHVYAWYAANIFDDAGDYIRWVAGMAPELKTWLYQ